MPHLRTDRPTCPGRRMGPAGPRFRLHPSPRTHADGGIGRRRRRRRPGTWRGTGDRRRLLDGRGRGPDDVAPPPGPPGRPRPLCDRHGVRPDGDGTSGLRHHGGVVAARTPGGGPREEGARVAGRPTGQRTPGRRVDGDRRRRLRPLGMGRDEGRLTGPRAEGSMEPGSVRFQRLDPRVGRASRRSGLW